MCIVIIETDVEILRLWEQMAAIDEMDGYHYSRERHGTERH